MCEARTKTLLHNLNVEFELLHEQNSSLAAKVAQLRAQLGQDGTIDVVALLGTPKQATGMMQQNLAFLKDRRMPPPPSTQKQLDVPPFENEANRSDRDGVAAERRRQLSPATPMQLEIPNFQSKAMISGTNAVNPFMNGTNYGKGPEQVLSNKSIFSVYSEPSGPFEVSKSQNQEGASPGLPNNMVWDEQDPPRAMGSGTKLWPAWEENPYIEQVCSNSSMRLARSMVQDDDPNMDENLKNVMYGAELRSKGCLQHLVARPSSPRQIVWDLFSVVFMCCDVLLVPLQAFDIPHTFFHKVLDWASVIFWTLDIPNNFFTGFHRDGVFEMRPIPIARRYIHKLFFLDLTIVIVDWLVVVHTSSFRQSEIVRIVKSYRIARALRLIRVVRIAKLLNMIVELSDHIAFLHSDTIRIVIDVTKIILFIFVASHFIACGFYAIANIDELGERGALVASWVERFALDQGGDPSTLYQYVTALHWALTQFTPASMEVVPRNVAERTYAIVVLVLAVVTFSSFVSSITSSMTRLRIMNMERSKQREDIRRYIVDHKMTLGVGNRINQFLRKQDSELQRRVHEEDVSLFKYLPEALRVDMHREVFLPVLIPHPFFYHFAEFLNDASLATICHSAMRERALGQGEYIFNYGEAATHMYFILSGKGEYSLGASIHSEVVNVGGNSMLSEAVLWVPWEHAGRLLVVRHVELAMLDSLSMQGILRGQPAVKPARAYALQYLERKLVDRANYTDLCTELSEALEMAQIAWSDVEKTHETAAVSQTSNRRINRLRGFVRRIRKSFALATSPSTPDRQHV